MKVGVLVVAYNAETTLLSVLDRIPQPLRSELCEVLVQDDESSDRTFEVANAYLHEGTDLPLTVRRHARNLGYGGNQKTGYEYALDHGWDIVVLLHGDGQYAPEVMSDLIDPIARGEADAVFGSRMMRRGDARKGGMPLYKYVGNRILTTFQNAVTGARLSEWHSGYRAYRVSTLAELPLRDNSDGFDFDTEIILQLLAGGKRIHEVPIPTYYGDEICRVNGIAYARDITIDTLRYRLGRSGFGTGILGHTEEYEYKPTPTSSHGRVLELTRDDPAGRVLDVGCGPGWVAAEMRRRGHHVVGVDVHESEGAGGRMERLVVADLDQGLPDEVGGGYDIVIAADVLEHLRSPEVLLADLRSRLAPGGRIVASVPNIAHWYPRLRVVSGRFDYDQRGILDRTHLRFFTRRTFERLARSCGYTPVASRHTGLPVDALGLSVERGVGRLVHAVDALSVRVWPTLFAYQLVYELRPDDLDDFVAVDAAPIDP